MWGEILQTISVIIAATSVVIGVTAWRRSTLGQRRLELAEQTLVLFAEARDALRFIRSPIGYVGEGTSRPQSENENQDETELKNRAYVAIERYDKRSEVFAQLYSIRYRFEAYFGKEAARPFDEMNVVVNEIIMASKQLSRLWLRHGRVPMTKEQEAAHIGKLDKAEAVFWEGLTEPDSLTSHISDIMSQIEQTCQKIINPQLTICSVVNSWKARASRFWSCNVTLSDR